MKNVMRWENYRKVDELLERKIQKQKIQNSYKNDGIQRYRKYVIFVITGFN